MLERPINFLVDFRLFKQISARHKLLSFLYIAYLWNPLRDRIISDREKQSRRLGANLGAKFDSEVGTCDEERGDDNKTGEQEEEVCIPKLAKLAKIYYCLSTTTHLIILIHSVALKVRSVPKHLLADDFITCYMPRLHLHESLSQSYMIWFNMLFSSLHLFYRAFISTYGSNLRLSVVNFLLVDKFNQMNEQSPPPSIIQSDVISSSSFGSDSLLFFPINLIRKHRMGFKLRPNRTVEARRKLIGLIDSSFVLTIICLSTPTLVLFPIGLSELLFNHEPIFEGCRISYYDSVYWLRTLSSMCVCLIMLLDSYLEFTFPIGFTNIIVVDLMLYWRHIEDRMWQLRRQLARQLVLSERGWLAKEPCLGDMMDSAAHRLPPDDDQYLAMSDQVKFRRRLTDIEQDMCELRALMNDFFENLRQTDKFVSLVLFFSFCVWLSSNALTTLLGLQLSSSPDLALLIRGFQLIGISLIALISHLILHLKRNTRPAYTTVCSLMALDKSKSKKDWIKTVCFYTDERSLYAFTFFGAGTFDEMMFFKFISYALTLTLLVETFQKQVNNDN